MDLTDGALLGGKVIYRQPAAGYRTGIEPVLLAASIPAKAGDRVLEGGTGAGAGLLCLLNRVPGLSGLGIERDPALAGIAQSNLRANGHANATVVAADLVALPPPGSFDHAMANPPWHREHGPRSPHAMRDGAKRGTDGLLALWAGALARCLRPGGSLTMVLPAALLADATAAMAASGCGSLALLPLWPRAAEPARLMLIHGLKARRGACRILPGLVLHAADGYTAAADAVLRGAGALSWASDGGPGRARPLPGTAPSRPGKESDPSRPPSDA